jgi:outer membrane immunogenic protein
MVRKFSPADFVALTIVFVMTHGARAADLPAPSYTKAPAMSAPVSNWTGFYVGANGGYGWKNTDVTETPGDPNTARVAFGFTNVPPATASFAKKGGLGGIQLGDNWQFTDRLVAGVETDFDWSDVKGDGSAPTTIAFGATPATFNASQKIEWFGTLRARLGYLPTDNLLLYATGGLAYGRVDESANVVLPPGASNSTGNFGFGYACGTFYGNATCFTGAQSRTSAGWAVGGGAEYAFSRNVSLKFEYLYVNLGSGTFASPTVVVSALTPSFLNTSSGDAAFGLARIGLNYRF